MCSVLMRQTDKNQLGVIVAKLSRAESAEGRLPKPDMSPGGPERDVCMEPEVVVAV